MYRNLLPLIILFSSGTLVAQLSRNDSRINDAFTDLTNRVKPTSATIANSNFNGDPYLDSKFHESTVVYFGKTLKEKIFLRYNAFSDEMEMSEKANTQKTEQALIKNSKISCIINKQVYKYLPLKNGNEFLGRAGYVQEIHKGNQYSLYLRKRKVFREGKKARTSLERSFPPRFIDETEWYLQKGEGALEFFKPTKKYLKFHFKTNQKRLESFLKNNKGDLKNIETIKDLISYMDSKN